jgi:uncharacterized protein YndB with AHSA1/START domain
MARQSATQHLDLLEAANLVATVCRGREKLHYLNPVPLWDIHLRWIERFEPPRLRALHAIKRHAEQAEDAMADRPTFVYVTYIQSSAERVWEALTQPEITALYWGVRQLSDWQVGSRWEHHYADGSGRTPISGTVLESRPPHRLVLTWGPSGETAPDKISKVTFEIEPYHDIVRLTVIHEELDDEMFAGIAQGWPAALANLKSLLETGHVLSRSPLEMAHQRTPADILPGQDGHADRQTDRPTDRWTDRRARKG